MLRADIAYALRQPCSVCGSRKTVKVAIDYTEVEPADDGARRFLVRDVRSLCVDHRKSTGRVFTLDGLAVVGRPGVSVRGATVTKVAIR